MPSSSLELVFKYFFAVGSGVGAGLLITVGVPLLIYRKFKGGMFTWRGSKR